MLSRLPFDRLVSARFEDDAPEVRRRARLVAAFALIGLAGGSTLAGSHLLWFEIPFVHVIAPLVAGLISVAAIPVLLHTRSIAAGGHMVALAWLIATGWGVYLRGGLASPPAMTLAASALIAMAIIGRRAALVWAGIVVGEYLTHALLPVAGVVLPDRMAVAHHVTSNILTSSLFGSLLLMMGLAQEWLRQTAMDELAIAERRKRDAEREAQLVRENRLASVGQLAASMAHEINNPLAYVVGNLEHLQASLPEGDDRDAAADALDGAQRMRTIVRDLKTYSRQDDEQVREVELHTVVSSTLRMVTAEVRRTAQLRTELAACPEVMANETRLGQVLVNLVMNAAQALPDRPPADNEIVVRAGTDAAGHAILEVRDNGAGMSADVLARASEPFFTTKPVGVGTGLGLSVCDNLVRRFGGSMRIASAVGVGTTVTIVLPPASRAATEAEPVTPSPRGPRLKILVVDDDAAVRRTLRRALAGHEVTDAGGGRAALALVDAGRTFDVIVCDLMMPDVAGVDVVEALAARPGPAPARRVVLMTGGVSCPRGKALLAANRYPVLDKPIDQAALQRVLAS